MAVLTVNLADDLITYKGVTYKSPVEDDMGSFKALNFESPTSAFAEHISGFGEVLEEERASGLFDRFVGMWTELDQAASQAQSEREAALEEEQRTLAEANAKAEEDRKAPIYIPPTKVAVMTRMTDDELEKLDALIGKKASLRMLWQHSDSFSDTKERVMTMFTENGFSVARVNELFADVQLNLR